MKTKCKLGARDSCVGQVWTGSDRTGQDRTRPDGGACKAIFSWGFATDRFGSVNPLELAKQCGLSIAHGTGIHLKVIRQMMTFISLAGWELCNLARFKVSNAGQPRVNRP